MLINISNKLNHHLLPRQKVLKWRVPALARNFHNSYYDALIITMLRTAFSFHDYGKRFGWPMEKTTWMQCEYFDKHTGQFFKRLRQKTSPQIHNSTEKCMATSVVNCFASHHSMIKNALIFSTSFGIVENFWHFLLWKYFSIIWPEP